MRSSTDAVRSLRRYVFESLGDGWEVRLSDEEGVFSRPFARVNSAVPMTTRRQGLFNADCMETFAIVCYPTEQASPHESLLEAERVRDLLWVAFEVGTLASAFGRSMSAGPTSIVRRGHGRRVPLYDYDGIAAFDEIEDSGEPRRASNDFMRVIEDPEIAVIPDDPKAPWAYAVTCSIRMLWARNAAVHSEAMTVESVKLEAEGS